MSSADRQWHAQQNQVARAEQALEAQAQAEAEARAQARAQLLAQRKAQAQAQAQARAAYDAQQASVHRQATSPVKHSETTHARQQPAASARAEPVARSEPVVASVETAAAGAGEKASGQRQPASPAVASETVNTRDDEEPREASVEPENHNQQAEPEKSDDALDGAYAEYERLMHQDRINDDELQQNGDAGDHDDYDVATIEHTLIYPQDGSVSIPFDPSELVDPVVPGMVPGSRRWRFEAVPTAADEGKIVAKIVHILLGEKFDLDRCSISLPPASGREGYIQIHFELLADYVRAASLCFTWNGRRLELIRSTAPLRKRSTVLKVFNLGGSSEQIIAISNAVQEFVTIDNIWRLDHVVLINETQSVTVTGSTLLVLATFRDHPSVGYYGPGDLPGVVSTRTSTHAMHFIRRTNRCGCQHERDLQPGRSSLGKSNRPEPASTPETVHKHKKRRTLQPAK